MVLRLAMAQLQTALAHPHRFLVEAVFPASPDDFGAAREQERSEAMALQRFPSFSEMNSSVQKPAKVANTQECGGIGAAA